MRARIVTALATIAMATAVAVSGCSDSTAPEPLAKSNSGKKSGQNAGTKPSEPESKAPAPAMPKLAKAHTDHGAGAFVRHVVELYNHGIDTGDHTPIDDIAESDCEKCDELYPPAPQRIEDAHWKVTGPVSYGVDKDPYTAKVFLPMKTAAGKLYEDDDSKPTTLAAYSWTLEATLSWKGDSWGIKALDVES